MSRLHSFRSYLAITKLPLCLLVALSAGFGFSLTGTRDLLLLVTVIIAVLMLACGAAALNSLQEYHLDRLMPRTAGRALALQRVGKTAALLQARVLLALGLLGLYFFTQELRALLAGALGVVVYNFIYTPLKHKTVWALLAGAVSGFIPPVIGWLAAGGRFLSTDIILVSGLFFLWQVPHYWLVVLIYQDDYRSSPLPSIRKQMGERRLGGMVFLWVISLAVMVHLLLLFSFRLGSAAASVLSGGTILLLAIFAIGLFLLKKPQYRLLFASLNAYMLLVMIVGSAALLGQR